MEDGGGDEGIKLAEGREIEAELESEVGEVMRKDIPSETEMEQETSSSIGQGTGQDHETHTTTSPSASHPPGDKPASSSPPPPTTSDPQVNPKHEDSTPPPASRSALPLPSTAAHTLLINTPSVSDTTTDPHPLAQPSASNPPTQPAPTPTPTQPTPSMSPASLRLTLSIATLTTQLTSLQAQLSASNALLPNPALAPSIVKKHITLLHEYNAIKDVGLGLMGMIAEGRGVRVGDIIVEMGVGEKD
jgi:DNA repair protein Swi5/Sae3